MQSVILDWQSVSQLCVLAVATDSSNSPRVNTAASPPPKVAPHASASTRAIFPRRGTAMSTGYGGPPRDLKARAVMRLGDAAMAAGIDTRDGSAQATST